ncbi:MAG: hypothetical protein L3J78_04395, partial [Thermoplasmata archaeon]|nr:hypothetical protein [Thermoplasmata archaeon]
RTPADSPAARTGRSETIAKVRANGTKALLPGLARNLLGPDAAPEWRSKATVLIERARVDGVVAGLAAMASRPDRSAVLSSFRGPRLVLHGVKDALIPVAEAADLPPRPPATRVILPEVGHMPMWEAREATVDALLSWARATLPGYGGREPSRKD